MMKLGVDYTLDQVDHSGVIEEVPTVLNGAVENYYTVQVNVPYVAALPSVGKDLILKSKVRSKSNDQITLLHKDLTRANRNTAFLWRVLGNLDYGADIREWMKLPPGTYDLPWRSGGYYGGTLGTIAGTQYVAPYNPGAPNNGWRHLRAQEPGAVQCDLSNNAGGSSVTNTSIGGGIRAGESYSDNVGVGALRTSFEGIDFNYGVMLFTGSSHVAFFNCRHNQFMGAPDGSDAKSFKRQWNDVANAMSRTAADYPADDFDGSHYYRDILWSQYMKGNGTPTAVRLQRSQNGTKASNIWWICSDVIQSCDDGLFLGESQMKAYGGRIIKVSNRFSNNLTAALFGRAFHNDCIQWVGGEDNCVFQDMLWGQHLELVAEVGSVNNTVILRVWYCNADTIGSLGVTNGAYNITGSITGFYFFCNGVNANSEDRAYSQQYAIYPVNGDNTSIMLGSNSAGDGTHFINLQNSLPSGVSKNASGLLVDYNGQVVNHINNPAMQFRAGHQDCATTFAELGVRV